MADKKNILIKYSKFIVRLVADYLLKLFVNNNIVYENDKIIAVKNNGETLAQLDNPNKKKYIIDSLEEIRNYNDDFQRLTFEFITDINAIVNRLTLSVYIKNKSSGYFYKKAIFQFSIKILLILFQFILILIYQSKFYECKNIPTDEEKFWKCEKYINCKVSKDNFNSNFVFYTRIIYFVVFDILYIINEIVFLIKFRRFKFSLYVIIVYQITNYFTFIMIQIFIFFRKNNCIASENNPNLFYLNDNFSVDLILLIFDGIKSFIK
jgi:hypothetical protein